MIAHYSRPRCPKATRRTALKLSENTRRGSRWRSLSYSISLIAVISLCASCFAQGSISADSPPDSSAREALKSALKKPLKERYEIFKKHLSSLEYHVTQESGTERPFRNRYWDHKQEGIYVDVISGIPLFSSVDKFKSGTGWPSFDRPLNRSEVLEVVDESLNMRRIEIRSRTSGAHLGHVFEDGPPTTGRRFCMNSAAMRFVPLRDMEREGYQRWMDPAKLTRSMNRARAQSPSTETAQEERPKQPKSKQEK